MTPSRLRSAADFARSERPFLAKTFCLWTLWAAFVIGLWAAGAALGFGFDLAVASIALFSSSASFCARLSLAAFRRPLPRAGSVLIRSASAASPLPASWPRLLRAGAAFSSFAAATALPCFIFAWLEANAFGSSSFSQIVASMAAIFSKIAWLLLFGADACASLPDSSILAAFPSDALCGAGRLGAGAFCSLLLLVGPASGLFSAARRSDARRLAAAWSATCAERSANEEARILLDAARPGRDSRPPSL